MAQIRSAPLVAGFPADANALSNELGDQRMASVK
jgi:hypothetical protein